MVIVRLPGSLRQGPDDTIVIDQPLATIDDLVDALDLRLPGFAQEVAQASFNFAVNDVLLLHGAGRHAIADGDTVEIIPTISGGSEEAALHSDQSHPPTGRTGTRPTPSN